MNKINEFEAYAIMDAKSQPDGVDTCPSSTASRPLCENDLAGNYFFLEIFSGSGRLSSSLEKHFRNAGRQIKVIRFDIKANLDDDILRNDTCNKLQTLINSGYCVGV